MTVQDDAVFAALTDRIDRFLADDGQIADPGADPLTIADAFVSDAETVLEAWLTAKGTEPTQDTVEGFRLLALHRQGARGDHTFNACRETCREVVYLRNVIALYDDEPALARHYLRLQAMVVRHLALFVGGKLHEAGLGDFCCSSRPVRVAETLQSLKTGT